ncbi:structural maintenance of chromosomes 4-like [Paramuricea clavata]|uniref:Structural maintenance of chromosomes protein 4 n=2 Tax=Paramuricea clavata TaxID=317549 RepID=A0A7D9IFD7_PARCT|nr:structural maintenance of chromosomes 4-like [Paramuricea clavata]
MMKPKALTEHEEGMLEYLEDIIGSSRYKQPIEECAKSVEELNEARGEKLNRVKAVEKEKDELEGVKNEAVEYLNIQNSICKEQNKLYQKNIYDCHGTDDQAKKERDKVNELYTDLKKRMEECSERKKAKGKEIKKLGRLQEQLAKTAEETKANFNAFERNDLKLREELKHRKQESKKLEPNLQKERKKLEDLTAEPEKNRKKLEELEKKKTSVEEKKKVEDSKLNEIMAGLKEETEGLQAEKEAKEGQLLEMSKSVNEAKSKLDVAKSELEIYSTQQDGLKKQEKEAKGNLENGKEKLKDLKRDIETIKAEFPENKKQLEKTKVDLEKIEAEEKKLCEELRISRSKAEEARSALQAVSTRGKVLEALLNEKQSGNLKGIYGRLGDLGAIDDKYDVAISTACGPLDNIVCDTIETAQNCVNFLKRNNIGSATFIALDKVENWRKNATSTINTPENVPRLYDLVKVKDEKIKTAFYFALRDTLVGKDLEQATRISDKGGKRWRVVTLQGQLVEQSGAMTGGGSKVSRGRMGSSIVHDVTPQQLQELERKLEVQTNRLEECRRLKKTLEESMDDLSKTVSTQEHQLQKNEMEVQALIQQEKDLTEQIKNLQIQLQQTVPDKNHLKQLEQKVKELEKEWQKVSSVSAKVEAEVQSLHKQIMDIGGSKLKAQQAKVDIFNKGIDEITREITKTNVALKSSARNITKSEEKIKTLEKEIEDNKEALETLQKEFSELDENAAQVFANYNDAQAKMKQCEEDLSTLREEYERMEEEFNKMKAEQVDVKNELEKCDTHVKENEGKIKYWKKEISKLELQSVGLSNEEDFTLPTLNEEELQTLDKTAVKNEIETLEEKLREMKPNMAAIEEYRKKEEQYLQRVTELDKITEERDNKRKEYEALRTRRLNEFMEGFSIITMKLKEMYQMITLGGDAELELVDSLDPFTEGVVFSVRPPKKSWKNISNLSGGEKTLSSLALVFALHHFKPTPLYVMDEIDAALDFRNVSIVAHYIKERTKNAQFIIISLRNNMFELADRLVGIFKTDDCTKSVTINPPLFATGTSMVQAET